MSQEVKQEYRPGTLRYTNSCGEVVITAPRDPLYSLAVFVATEYYANGEWKPIDYPEGEDE